MLGEECGTSIVDVATWKWNQPKNYKNVNKLLQITSEPLHYFLKDNKCSSSKFQQIINGINENTTLIRNEVYRYNKLVDNLNINKESLLFALFVEFMRLKKIDKI